MEISVNRTTRTIDIMVPRDQVSDELLGVLPEPTTIAEGTLAWSIRFGDVRRSSNSTGVAEDALLGPVGAIVGSIASQGRSSSVEAEGKIQGALILTFNDSLLEESASTGTSRTLRPYSGGVVTVSSASLDTLPRLREEFSAELNVTESQQISLGSRSTQMQSGLQTIPLWLSSDAGISNMPTLLFANPFSG